jgi:hypothetical protein
MNSDYAVNADLGFDADKPYEVSSWDWLFFLNEIGYGDNPTCKLS